MLDRLWTGRSLRFWVAVGMALSVLPLCISAVGGYFILDRGVILPFHDVAARQRDQVGPTQNLRVLIWETLAPVDEFVDEGRPSQPMAYRELRRRIEAAFARVHEAMGADAETRTLVERARDDWTEADRLATEALSVARPPGDPHEAELMDRFHGLVQGATDKLAAVYADIAVDIAEDHHVAERAYERSQWLAAVAAAGSALMIIIGVYIIGRMMALSVDRLVDGAQRFAEGDREHRIDVQVPPELHKVADEFNRMIVRIHESEEALADLAQRDGLTRLFNRRAFDDALREAHQRLQRRGEPVAMLLLDLDHFKRINDIHGHTAGDAVLRATAEVMTTKLRLIDRVYRFGGEEFAALLPDTDIGDARQTAERLRMAIETHQQSFEGREIRVTSSIGVAAATSLDEVETLVESADAALYRAKAEGRNRVMVQEGSGAAD